MFFLLLFFFLRFLRGVERRGAGGRALAVAVVIMPHAARAVFAVGIGHGSLAATGGVGQPGDAHSPTP